MDILKLLTLLLFVSCAKVSYMTQQSLGQMSLLWNSRENEEVLKDPKVKEEHKEKIRKIITYKKYFYDYYKRKSTDIYSQTTMLKNKAVTHLVIASPFYKVQPVKHWFPIVGTVPYLGFYDIEDAKDFQKDLEEDDYVTYRRPVYAYSTLGYFEDRILSSFFLYKDEGLAELVFHELFHTIFFAKNEVGLNEALANYFGKEMMIEYFKYSDKKVKEMKQDYIKNKKLGNLIVKLSNKLNEKYMSSKAQKNKKKAKEVLESFMTDTFKPEISSFCRVNNIHLKKCYPLNSEWNNAKLAAFGTYQNDMEKIESLRVKNNFNLVQFLEYIEKKYQSYESQSKIKKFKNFLFGEK